MHVKLTVEYEGTAYHGWQIQPNGPTIQAALEEAAARMFGVRSRMAAAGRTDAGVHAVGQVVCFHLDRPDCDLEEVRRGLDALTPDDIVVRRAELVAEDFDPRRSARSRTYEYRIWNALVPTVVWRRFAWHVRKPLNLPAMSAAAAALLGERDFSSFQAADCDADNPVRRVLRSEIERSAALLTYTITATAFLRHMVRNIVGTLVEVGLGERTPEEFAALIAACDRTLAGPTAPPKGLCLVAVEYDEGEARRA
jgi:tRNA pseudouridine38-40 synthase